MLYCIFPEYIPGILCHVTLTVAVIGDFGFAHPHLWPHGDPVTRNKFGRIRSKDLGPNESTDFHMLWLYYDKNNRDTQTEEREVAMWTRLKLTIAISEVELHLLQIIHLRVYRECISWKFRDKRNYGENMALVLP